MGVEEIVTGWVQVPSQLAVLKVSKYQHPTGSTAAVGSYRTGN
jgi:hypothetical protein